MSAANISKKRLSIILISIVPLLGLAYAIKTNNQLLESNFLPFKYYLNIILNLAIRVHSLFYNNISLDGYEVLFIDAKSILFKIQHLELLWIPLVLSIIWISPKETITKVKYSLAFIMVHFIILLIKITSILFIHTNGMGAYDSLTIGRAISYMLVISFIFFWIKKAPELLKMIGKRFKLDIDFIQLKMKEIFILAYIMITTLLILALFSFEPWINFLFGTSHYILHFLGYYSEVVPFYLLGENGNIFMAKGCLGIKTTVLFASFIYLTGSSFKKKLSFISIGVILLNIVNILRFVFLFIHLQNHGEYLWKLEVHDMFNILIYLIVFILWIIWLEWFSDIWPHLKNQKSMRISH